MHFPPLTTWAINVVLSPVPSHLKLCRLPRSVRLFSCGTLALCIVRQSRTRASHLLKVHDNIVAKHGGALGHDIEVVAESVLVFTPKAQHARAHTQVSHPTYSSNEPSYTLPSSPESTDRQDKTGQNSPHGRTPPRVPRAGTQVRHHDGDALPRGPAHATAGARRGARRVEPVAGAATRPAPAAPAAPAVAAGVVQGLRRRRRVHVRRHARLPGEPAAAAAAPARAHGVVGVVALILRRGPGSWLVFFFFSWAVVSTW